MNKDNDILARFDAFLTEVTSGENVWWVDTDNSKWNVTNNIDFVEKAQSFLLKEIERALTEQRRVIFQRYRQIGDSDTANSILAERFESGITAERERILALIEGKKKPMPNNDGHYSNCYKNTGKSLNGECNCGTWRNDTAVNNNTLTDLTAAINNPNTQ